MRDAAVRRWMALAAAVAVLAVLAGCSRDEEPEAPILQPTEAAVEQGEDSTQVKLEEQEELASAGGRVEPPQPVGTAFQAGMTRVAVVDEGSAGASVTVFFVDADAEDLIGAANECIDSYLQQFDSVECFAFRTETDLTAAGIDPERGNMQQRCWLARARVSFQGSRSSSDSNPTYASSGCPGSAGG